MTFKEVSLLVALALVAGAISWFAWIKSIALQGATVDATAYNPAGTCYALTVEANLEDKVSPISENLFFLLHSRIFYRIFDKDGRLMASTDWRFLEPTVDTDHARWAGNSTLVYPANGYQSLDVAGCKRKHDR